MKEAAYIEAELNVHFHTPFHLGAGHGDVSINRVVKRTAGKRPYVPASALKGALRMAAERVIQVVDNLTDPDGSIANRQRKGQNVLPGRCRAPRPPAMCQSKQPCLVCRVFGNGYTGVRLLVDDARADTLDAMTVMHKKVFKEEPVLAHSETITRVQIDRRNKGSKKGALFSSEYTPPTQRFKSKISGRLPLSIIDESVPRSS